MSSNIDTAFILTSGFSSLIPLLITAKSETKIPCRSVLLIFLNGNLYSPLFKSSRAFSRCSGYFEYSFKTIFLPRISSSTLASFRSSAPSSWISLKSSYCAFEEELVLRILESLVELFRF
jgi:hypothetical protein